MSAFKGRAETGNTQRILVVDDNTDAAETLGMLLKVFGHQVRTANDGETALNVFREFHPEIVLLDIGLPRIDGYQVALRMRENSQSRKVIIVALTGYGQDEDRRRSKESGIDHHLVKPVDPEALQELLARY